MNKDRLVRLLILAAAVNVFGCGGAAEKAGGESKAAPAPAVAEAASPTPAADAATTTAAGPAPAPTSTSVVTASAQGTSPASASRGAGSAPPARMPTPRIGSGGNDLFLFTQARAAVNADPELKAANLVIEVKEGVVTLNGTVASAALKSKAEELARNAGPKAVKNQLQVSAGR